MILFLCYFVQWIAHEILKSYVFDFKNNAFGKKSNKTKTTRI